VSSLALLTTEARAERPADTPPAATAEGPAVGGRGRVVLADLLGFRATSGLPTGQTMLGGGAFRVGPFSFGTTGAEIRHSDGSVTTSRGTHFGLAPSLDVFVTDRLSLGGRGHIDYFSSRYDSSGAGMGGLEATGYGVGLWPRVGYVVPLGEAVALWPRLEVGADVTRQAFRTGERSLVRRWGAELDVGLVVRVAKHLLLDLGPVVAYSLTEQDGGLHASVARATSDGVSGGARASASLQF